MTRQILVLGMHRSGTSTVAGLLHHLGAFVGEDEELLGANPENPKGFWERKGVVQLNDQLLNAQRCSWHNPADWNPDAPAHTHAISQAEHIIAQLNTHERWAMKDPRQCLTLPTWLPLLEQPTCVIVHRDPLAVARSLRRRNKLTLACGLALWEYYVTTLLQSVGDQPLVWVNYDEVVAQPLEQATRLAHAIGVDPKTINESAITEFISPELVRSKPNQGDDIWLTDSQKTLLDIMHSQKLPKVIPQISEQACYTLRQSDEMMQVHGELYLVQEEVARARDTISAHDERLNALSRQISDDARVHQELHEVHQGLQKAYSTLEDQHQETETAYAALQDEFTSVQALLGASRAELDAIKATRLWKLREKIVN